MFLCVRVFVCMCAYALYKSKISGKRFFWSLIKYLIYFSLYILIVCSLTHLHLLLYSYSIQPMHFFPMAMYTHTLVPPPKEVSTELGETRSAKRGAVSIDILDETDGLGGLKDR